MTKFKRSISTLLACTMLLSSLPMNAQAGIVGTEETLAPRLEASLGDRARVDGFLAREDVQQALLSNGISPQAAAERVKAMSDAEVAELAGQVDQAPAGGLIGAIVFVFLVLLLTDILGLTKVFPFTRSVR